MKKSFYNLEVPEKTFGRYSEFLGIIKHFFLLLSSNNNFLSTEINNSIIILYPYFKSKIETIINEFYKYSHTDTLQIFETYRSQQRQHYLYSIGATKKLNYGMHYFYIACDIVFVKKGNITWNGDYNSLWEIAKTQDLFPISTSDLCHFQYITIQQQQELINLYKRILYLFQIRYDLVPDLFIGNKTIAQFKINKYRFNQIFNELLEDL